MNNEIFTLQDLSTRWKCDVRVLRRGELKTFHIGKATRITAAEVERIENQPTKV